ncbi:MAG: HAD-IA family hydrolase [Fidelibacterota bacterium]
MKRPDLICYDFDGTLCNTLPDITESMNVVLRKNGFEAVPEEQIRGFIGSGIGKLVERAIHYALVQQEKIKTDISAVSRIGKEMAEYYNDHLIVHSHLYPGTEKILRYFSDLPQIIVSNKPEAMVRRMLGYFQIDRYFDLLVGGDTLDVSKPDPAVWEYVKDKMKLSQHIDGLMVGDSLPDMIFGKTAGLRTIAVSYGYNDAASLEDAGAEKIIDSLDDLRTII